MTFAFLLIEFLQLFFILFARLKGHITAGSVAGAAVHFNAISTWEKSSVRGDVWKWVNTEKT